MSSRPDEPTWFDEPREWSRWKHFILERYLGRFTGILSHHHPLLYYVDGFAGAGLIGSGENQAQGSPLLAAALAERTAARPPGSGTTLRCINIEQDRDTFQQLIRNTARYHTDLVQNLHGAFSEQIDTVLMRIGAAPTLFFVDPFGYVGAEVDVLGRLRQRPAHAITELLVYYSPSAVRRVAGRVRRRPDDPKTLGMSDSLDRNFGSAEWRAIFQHAPNAATRDVELLSLYRNRLAGALAGRAFSFAVRSIQGQIKYYLVYFTRHAKGIRTMSEVLFDARQAYDGEFVRTNLPLLGETPGLADDVDVERLADAIYQLGLRHHRLTFGQVQEQLAASDEWFGRVKTPHCRRACQSLIDAGKIRRATRTGIAENEVLVFVQQLFP